MPKRVWSLGGRFGYEDQGQTPNCQLTVMDFGGPLLVFEVVGLNNRAGVDGKKYPTKVDNEFYLEEGSEIMFTQSAVVLEQLISKYLFSSGGSDDEED